MDNRRWCILSDVYKNCNNWASIHGFPTPGLYKKHLHYLENLVMLGDADEVPFDPSYGKGEIYGGRWFRCNETAAIWRLVPPDFPFRGLWEQVLIS